MLLLVASLLVAAPAPLVHLARVWGEVRYLHPRAAALGARWDEALVRAVPLVEAASSLEEERAALQGMLAALDDSATRVFEPAKQSAVRAGCRRWALRFEKMGRSGR